MPSQNKLIKQGITYTDSLFKEIENRLIQSMRASDTLEEFVANLPEDYEVNPLLATGYKDKMLDLILQETNNHRFSRPSQKELTRVTIENQVGGLIVDVGEDIRDSVREIVKDGYNNNLSQQEIAENISSKVTSIRNTRARVIARTEIARTATISDYVINAERGATHFYVECRNTACPICKKAWHKGWTEENNDTFKPSDSSAGGKGWIGNRTYSMSDTSKLPPIHPNCRCVPYFVSEDEIPKGATIVKETTTPTESVLEQHVSTDTANNNLLRGKYETYTEVDNVSKSKVTVYKYENGFELAINENAILTHEEVVSHINSLPKPLRNLPKLKRINIKDWQSAQAGGEYRVAFQDINVYAHSNSTKIDKLDTLTHELAHAKDFNGTFVNNLSLKDIYEKIFKEDNKLYTFVKSNGRKKTPKKFPTDYAGRSYLKYAKDFKKRLKIWERGTKTMPKPTDKSFTEDFAESTKLYLNPAKHEQFVKDFPNRAKYLKSIYDKPNFDKNSPLYKELIKEGLL